MLFVEAETAFARAVVQLAYGNPFLPARIDAERAALGPAFDPAGTLWHSPREPDPAPNVRLIAERVAALVTVAHGRLAAGQRSAAGEADLYETLVLYHLYEQGQAALFHLAQAASSPGPVAAWRPFREGLARLLGPWPDRFPGAQHTAHLFACAFQVRRAFHHVFSHILGDSPPALRLRAAVWQSIFTHDLGRYRRALFARMADIPTLVLGPTGTGKELVARAIAYSRYVPFDSARGTFAETRPPILPLNLSALSPGVVEAELFGHARGAFTGALRDRVGWLERCPPLGTVFLDEIGEVDPAIQVKLLRVLQTRTFQRLGETEDRPFTGKLVAATNRDLGAAIAAGRFREDFYYRLCADVIETPSLAERLQAAPGERRTLLAALAARIAGPDEGPGLAAEAEAWIAQHLPPDYAWPGNVRELEQCLRNVLVRGTYQPPRRVGPEAREALVGDLLDGAVSLDELTRRYCTLVYAETGSYVETARRLGVDRRTAQRKVDPVFLATLRPGLTPPRDPDNGHPTAQGSDA